MSKRECNCVCLDPVQGFDLVFRFSVCIINLITDVVQYCHVHVRIRRTVRTMTPVLCMHAIMHMCVRMFDVL